MKSRMKKWWQSITALFMVMISVIVLGVASITPVKAEDKASYQTKKIVSVMFDDSGSMTSSAQTGKGSRYEYARYAFQLLMSLLDSNDELYITLMNKFEDNGGTKGLFDSGIDYYNSTITVDLSKEDRNAEVERILNAYFSAQPSGQTPGEAVDAAIDVLEEKGLKTQDELLKEDSSNEYWLFIFTDGAFTSPKNSSGTALSTEQAIGNYIANFPSLHTIYCGFSKDAADLSNSDLIKKHKFTSYVVKDLKSVNETIEMMQKVSSQISGQYQIDPSDYAISGNKITIDLDKCGVPLNSISVIAQNCGAKLKKASYNGTAVPVAQECIIDPAKGGGGMTVPGMGLGYTGIIKGNPCLAGGIVELEFDSELSANASISILAEPAMFVDAILEYNGEVVTPQYINEHLTPGQKIIVKYKAYEYINNTEVDLDTVFGGVANKVTYAQGSYVCGEEIALKQGINEVGLEVSVMNGAYTMYASRTIVVEANPNYYRVEEVSTSGGLNETSRSSVYNVYANNAIVSGNKLYKEGETLPSNSDQEYYVVEASVTNSKGEELPVNVEIASDGKITVTYAFKNEEYGEYQEYVKVTSNKLMSRELTSPRYYLPPEITVALTSDSILTYTNYQIEKNMGGLAFELTANGESITFPAELFDYKVTLDGRDITASTTVEGDRIAYVPSLDDFGGSVSLGQKALKITLTSKNNLTKPSSCDVTLTVTNAIVEIDTLPNSIKKVDRFDLVDTKAVMYFRVRIDGYTLTAEELQARFDSGALSVSDKGTFSGFVWLPCGKDVAIETVDGIAVVAVHVTNDWIKPFHSFAAMLIINGEKDVVITCHGVEHTDAFLFNASPLWSYIWRILVILLVIHTLLFLIGFFKSHNLPSGTFVKIDFVRNDEKAAKITAFSDPMNLTFGQKWLWHIKRFFFLKPYFASQNAPTIGKYFSLSLDKNGMTKIHYLGPVHEVKYSRNVRTNANVMFTQYMELFEDPKYHGGDPAGKPKIPSGELKPLFSLQRGGLKNAEHEDYLESDVYYTILKKKSTEITSVIVFKARG